MDECRNRLDRDKLRMLRERIRQRVGACNEDPARIHEGCFLEEVVADLDEIGWPDMAVGKRIKLHEV